jgi:hypothetical protein
MIEEEMWSIQTPPPKDIRAAVSPTEVMLKARLLKLRAPSMPDPLPVCVNVIGMAEALPANETHTASNPTVLRMDFLLTSSSPQSGCRGLREPLQSKEPAISSHRLQNQ